MSEEDLIFLSSKGFNISNTPSKISLSKATFICLIQNISAKSYLKKIDSFYEIFESVVSETKLSEALSRFEHGLSSRARVKWEDVNEFYWPESYNSSEFRTLNSKISFFLNFIGNCGLGSTEAIELFNLCDLIFWNGEASKWNLEAVRNVADLELSMTNRFILRNVDSELRLQRWMITDIEMVRKALLKNFNDLKIRII